MKRRNLVMVLTLLSSVTYAFNATDSASVTLKTNVDATIEAIPISMIEGNVPNKSYEISLTANEAKTLDLPVDTKEDTPIIGSAQLTDVGKATIRQNGGRLSLALPADYVGGVMDIVSLNGRVLGRQEFQSSAAHSLSVWGISSGIYLLKVTNGEYSYTKKLTLPSGDFLLRTEFTATQSAVSNVGATQRAQRAAAKYSVKVSSENSDYKDSTFEISLNREENKELDITLSKKGGQDTDIADLLDSATYDELFKHRYGINGTPGDYDFYSYKSLVDALEYLADFEATVYSKVGAGGDRMVVKKKSTGEIHDYVTTSAYHDINSEETEKFVDYSLYFAEGDLETRKQELCAYLANAAQETYGGWDTAPDGKYAWGLYWIHEAYPIYNENSKDDRFTENHSVYGTKATLEWSYHGRGPKQLTYNYNYGMMSDFIYFDKMVLLDDPNIIAREPVMSWVSSLWFWMTPQGQKPSCHDVMVDKWEPTSADVSAGRTTSKFGMTINIINGGVECGSSNEGNIRALGRKGHYEHFCDYFGIDPETNCTCHQMQPY